MSRENDLAAFLRIRDELAAPAAAAASDAIEELKGIQLVSADEDVTRSQASYLTSRNTLLITLLVGLVLAVGLVSYRPAGRPVPG